MIIGARSQPRPTSVRQAPAPVRRAAPPPRPAATQTFHDAGRSGNYGVPAANRYKAAPAYHQAVKQVFKAQPPVQKATIIRGLVKQKAYNTPEFRAVHDVFSKLPAAEQGMIASYSPRETSAFLTAGKFVPPPRESFNPIGGLGKLVTSGLGDIGKGIGLKLPGSGGIGDVRSLGGAISPQGILKGVGTTTKGLESALGVKIPGAGGIADVRSLGGGTSLTGGLKAANTVATNVSNATDALRRATTLGSRGPGNVQTMGLAGGPFAKNAARDIVDLPAEALPSLALPVNAALTNHWGQALHMVTDPYVQAFKDPKKAFAEHPVNTALMLSGLLHPATRAVDTGYSLARTGHLPNIKAESVHLTANLTHERPDFSKYPLIRSAQKAVEFNRYRRNAKGQLVPRDYKLHSRLVKLETSRLVGQNERVRTFNRGQQIAAHAKAVLLPKSARAAHSAKTALKTNPEPALIPGAGVLARIADHTIRRTKTVEADLQKHLDQVAANRPNLLGNPKLLAEHDAYVKQLQDALKNEAFLKNPGRALKAADAYARDYAPLEAKGSELGHFRDMSKDALDRRALAHTVLTHMPGAHFDAERGLMVGNRPLTTEEMRKFDAQQSGGRPIAFTSDQAAKGDKAFFVNGQHRPPTAAKDNTYFAYTHGLTRPGHEALLEQRVRMQGIIDAHRSMNRLADQLLVQNERTGRVRAWASYKAALKDAPVDENGNPTHVPIRLSQPFHPQDSLRKAFEAGKVNLATLEEEAVHRQLDINSRLQPSSDPGQWGLIDRNAAKQLKAHEDQISPNAFWRGLRGATNQFRRVALGTSFRHLPGVFQEQLIRAAAEGIGPISLLAGRAAVKRSRTLNPELGLQRQVELTGGMQTGQALSLTTRQVSHHFSGTLLEGPLSSFEKLMTRPGARQIGNAWHAWLKFTLNGTKRFLENNAAYSAIGKQVIADFGGRHGLLSAAMGQWGKMIDQAAHGILDENTARQMGAYVRRVYGRWTDLTPGEQSALMFSPFGMWWTNSIAWLMRMPVDHPVGAAFFAGLNTGTEKQRKALGLDMFSPHHLPLYQQGSIPMGNQLWQANYYSAFGVANNPGETAQSLIAPWQSELLRAFGGQDWKGSTINSPSNPRPDSFGGRKASAPEIGIVIGNSLLSSFVPLYTKAQTIVTGGGSTYDTSTAFAPQTKKANPGLLQGVKKAVMPIRLSANRGVSASSATTGTSSHDGWGSRTTSKSTGGWGPPPASKKSSGDGW